MAERLNDRFIAQMRYMNKAMKQDTKNGNVWKYCNTTKKKAKSFEAARKSGKFLINCVDGPQWALKSCGVPGSALSWFGAKGGEIAWCSKNAEKNCKKYFTLIKVGNKTVKQLLKAGMLCEGDILTYVSMNHTNAYIGDIGKNVDRSFDSGHAYAKGSGEGAVMKKWIGALSCKNQKVGYILRLKDRTHYRVQCGAYSDIAKFNEQTAMLDKAKIKWAKVSEDGMYKVQLGYFDGFKNAMKEAAKVEAKGFKTYIKEV